MPLLASGQPLGSDLQALLSRPHPAVEEPRAQLPGAAGHAQGVHQGLTIRALPGAGELVVALLNLLGGGGQALAEGEAGVAVAAVERGHHALGLDEAAGVALDGRLAHLAQTRKATDGGAELPGVERTGPLLDGRPVLRRGAAVAQGSVGELGVVLERLGGQRAAPRAHAHLGVGVDVAEHPLGPGGGAVSNVVRLVHDEQVGVQPLEQLGGLGARELAVADDVQHGQGGVEEAAVASVGQSPVLAVVVPVHRQKLRLEGWRNQQHGALGAHGQRGQEVEHCLAVAHADGPQQASDGVHLLERPGLHGVETLGAGAAPVLSARAWALWLAQLGGPLVAQGLQCFCGGLGPAWQGHDALQVAALAHGPPAHGVGEDAAFGQGARGLPENFGHLRAQGCRRCRGSSERPPALEERGHG